MLYIEILFFLWLNNISLHAYTIFCLYIDLLMHTWVVSIFWLQGIMLLPTLVYKLTDSFLHCVQSTAELMGGNFCFCYSVFYFQYFILILRVSTSYLTLHICSCVLSTFFIKDLNILIILFIFFVSENKFYLNKCLNTLHNIKTEVKKISLLLHMSLGSCC